MTPKRFSRRTIWGISMAAVLIAVLLILIFVTQKSSSVHESIILPAPSLDSQADQTGEQNAGREFLEITNNNVVTALQTLSRPKVYYQHYSVAVGADSAKRSVDVHLWAIDDLIRAEIRDNRRTRHLLSDGTEAYLWYEGDLTAARVALSEHMTEEDLLGLPEFDGYLTISEESLSDSGYVYLEEPQVPCIYVSAKGRSTASLRYWINLDNGLLYQADALEGTEQIYTVQQNAYEVMSAADTDLAARFRLPDGSMPFTAAEEMPQP